MLIIVYLLQSIKYKFYSKGFILYQATDHDILNST